MKKLKESASAGATSAGAIASNCGGGLNFPLFTRMPKSSFEYKIVKTKKK